ncbi:MAG: permease [Ktedonobacterales bacterium]
MGDLLNTALPWKGLLFFPALLVFIGVLLFSTATLAFYVKQSLSFVRLQKVFAARPGLSGNLLGAALGAVTPFCTCTAVPLFLGMLEVDVPLGPAVSFLLASPTINLGAIVLLLVVFGWRVAIFYAAACLLAAVVVGWALGRVPREGALRDYLWLPEDEPLPRTRRLAAKKAVSLGRQLTRKLLPWLALATVAGILIDTLVPTATVGRLGALGVGLGVPLAVLLGSVIYADILLLIPVGFALITHGASLPVVLVFMLAASGLSLPEMVVLGRVLRPRMVLLFVGATLVLYMVVGFGFTAV